MNKFNFGKRKLTAYNKRLIIGKWIRNKLCKMVPINYKPGDIIEKRKKIAKDIKKHYGIKHFLNNEKTKLL